jgi:hypothetical protein
MEILIRIRIFKEKLNALNTIRREMELKFHHLEVKERLRSQQNRQFIDQTKIDQNLQIIADDVKEMIQEIEVEIAAEEKEVRKNVHEDVETKVLQAKDQNLGENQLVKKEDFQNEKETKV